jgi:hypothetical protein
LPLLSPKISTPVDQTFSTLVTTRSFFLRHWAAAYNYKKEW